MASEHSFIYPAYTSTVHRAVYPAIDPKNPSNSATGKVVVVTGGGEGIGKAIAGAFVTAGAKAVAILGRRAHVLAEAKKELEAAGSSQILTHTADVLDRAALNQAFSAIAREAGPVDVVVANAGYLSDPEPAATADVDKYFASFDVNIKGTLLTFQAFQPHRNTTTQPVFLSLNTALAHARAVPNYSSYAASKAGQAVVVTYLQTENPDVRVVSFHPGVLQTAMLAKSRLEIGTDDMSLPSSYAVWLASPSAEWTGGLFLWAHWDVEELVGLKDEIRENNHLQLDLSGWARVAEPTLV